MNPANPCNAFVPGEMITVKPHREGKLSPLTFAVKEVYDVKGFITGAGNPTWKDTHPAAQTTAPAVERLLDEGATLIGKTISDEMAFSLDGENAHYGTPLNSRCPQRIPGGSSSGSAAAVAGNLVDFALGTDTAGSMRIPATYCGVYGMRTTHGVITMQGVHPLAQSFDAAGWFAHTPEVMAQVGSVMLGCDIPAFKARRLVVARDLFDTNDAALAAQYDALLERLSGHFSEVVDAQLGSPDFAEWIETLRCIQWWELNATHGEWIFKNLDAFGTEIRGRLENIPSVTREQMEAKRETRKQLVARLDSLITPDTLVVLPTAPGIAPLRGRSIEEARAGRLNTLRHTCIAAVAGLPQISMPLVEKDGCPIGISLMGARGEDAQLLAAALAFGKS